MTPLRVIEGNGQPWMKGDPTCNTDTFILPFLPIPEALHHELHVVMSGMTEAQANLAWKMALRHKRQRRKVVMALDNIIFAERALEKAFDVYRKELLLTLLESHPAAARRIMAGKSPKHRPKRGS